MGKQYYCDFCEKSFADNLANRRNHFNSPTHQRLRKLHYDLFRPAEIIFAEEMAKKQCRTFFSVGSCQFGDGCRYSHMTAERREEFQRQIQCEKEMACDVKTANPVRSGTAPSLEEWLQKRVRSIQDNTLPSSTTVTLHTNQPETELLQLPVYQIPTFLLQYPDIPPSLLPPRSGAIENLDQVDWG